MLHNEKYETLPRDELEQLQIERLQSTLNRVTRNVAFYRHAFDEHRVNIERVKSLEALRELPFTTKEDLGKAYPYDMFAVPLREIVRIHSASGITGKPIVVGYTRNDLWNWTECTARLLAAAGITANDAVQIAFPYNLSAGGFGFHQGAELIGASVIPSSAAASAEKQITIMKDFKTAALICTPSYALRIATVLEELQVHPERLHLKIGIFGGEPWSERLRAQVDERMHIRSLDTYGISDAMGPGVAGECLERGGLHINEDHFIAEVIDPETLQAVPEGRAGELVFTTITKEGFPFIRYRTGDLSAIRCEPCRCGRTFARMESVRGRTDDRFYFNGVGIYPSQIEEILRGEEEISPHFQVVLGRENGLENMEVKVEFSERTHVIDEVWRIEKLRDRLVRRIDTILDIQAQVAFVAPRSLQGPEMEKVVDNRPK